MRWRKTVLDSKAWLMADKSCSVYLFGGDLMFEIHKEEVTVSLNTKILDFFQLIFLEEKTCDVISCVLYLGY